MMKLDNDKKLYYIEFIIALAVAGACCVAGLSNILWASEGTLPFTVDGLGHMTKVVYMAEHHMAGEFASWFPNWYNGATVTQYYPPLSYLVMVPIYWLTGSVLRTYQIDCVLMMWIGSMGVWYYCRKYIGRWCGLFGIVVFAFAPYLTASMYLAGVMAQTPIYAIMPWFLIAITAALIKSNIKNFIGSMVCVALMILSHAMHAFMVCLCIMAVAFGFILFRKIKLRNFIYLSCSIIFAAFITAFWSVVGVTKLENPTIPYLLQEAIMLYTANISWFLNSNDGSFYFPYCVTITCIIAAFFAIFEPKRSDTRLRDSFYVQNPLFLTFFTIVFSFGLRLPFFKYLPFATSMVPGRILSFTSVTAAIVCAYLIYGIVYVAKEKSLSKRIKAYIVTFSICLVILISLNPYASHYNTIDGKDVDNMFETVNVSGNNFDKGRYEWLTPICSDETFFPMKYNLNMCDGWNIEGTPHNRFIWTHNIAIQSKCNNFIIKNMAFWNVRYYYFDAAYKDITAALPDRIDKRANRKGNDFLYDPKPSSYYMTDPRNALVIGKGGIGIGVEFANLVFDDRTDIRKFTDEELRNYDVIYMNQLEIKTLRDKKQIEDKIRSLLKRGVKFIIEPEFSVRMDLFGVTAYNVRKERGAQIVPLDPSKKTLDVPTDDAEYIQVLGGIDEPMMQLVQNEGKLRNSIVGKKKVEGGEIIFVGARLSQYLTAVHIQSWGMASEGVMAKPLAENKEGFKNLFRDLLHQVGVKNEFMPNDFPIIMHQWDYKSGKFHYYADKETPLIVSVTFAPRWQAKIDGRPVPIYSHENLISINVPAGDHTVTLEYGLTRYAILGYIISGLSLIVLIVVLIFRRRVIIILTRCGTRICRFLQLNWGGEEC